MENFYLKEIEINSYKKYSNERFRLNSNFTLFLGANATGKTTILDGIATLIGGFILGFKGVSPRDAHPIKNIDMNVEYHDFNGLRAIDVYGDTFIRGNFFINNENVSWRRYRKNKKSGSTVSKVECRKMYKIVQELDDNMESILPIFSYHGTGRIWEQEKKNTSKMGNLRRIDGYKGCLDAKSNYRNFVSWFEKLSRAAFETEEKIPILDKMKKVIIEVLNRLNVDGVYENKVNLIRYREGDLEILFKTGEIQRVGTLSGGYRNIIGMISDIAYRMAILNPTVENSSKKIPGIVLIDEIDLHLHPNWQKKIVKILRDVFPMVQFIATSHSPFIIQSTKENEIIRLDENEIDRFGGDASMLSIEDVTENIMEVELPQMSERKKLMLETAKRYYDILDNMVDEKLSKEELSKLKYDLDRLVKPFEENPAYSAFLERKRIVAESKMVK